MDAVKEQAEWGPAVAVEHLRAAGRLCYVGAAVAVVTRSLAYPLTWGAVTPLLGLVSSYLAFSPLYAPVLVVDAGAGLLLLILTMACGGRLRAGEWRAVPAGRLLGWLFVVDNAWCAFWLVGLFVSHRPARLYGGDIAFLVGLGVPYALLLVMAALIVRHLGRPAVREWVADVRG
jgi:hypothetical protein